jgi:hypothetical protein
MTKMFSSYGWFEYKLKEYELKFWQPELIMVNTGSSKPFWTKDYKNYYF